MPIRRKHPKLRTSADSVRLTVDGGNEEWSRLREATQKSFDHDFQLTAGD